jgi:hypothetical protein
VHSTGEHAYVGELAAAVFYLAASVHLLRASLRTGLVEGRILGTAFLFLGIGYGFYVAPDVVPSLLPLMTPLSFVGRFTLAVGTFWIAIFTWQVFRKDVAWAGWLAWGCGLLILLGIGVSIWEGDWDGFSLLTSVGYWLVWLGETIPLVWVGIEGFVGYSRSIKQVKFGFSDPLVANRFLLWCVFGIMQVCTMIVEIPMNLGFERQGVFAVWPDAAMGIFEVLTIAIVWLAFFPPTFYRNWVNGAAAAAGAAPGS